MHRRLFLLMLMGQCSLILCQGYKYYFIKEPKTWDEAQRYCREGYKDLATVPNMTYMKTLYTDSTENQGNAWIGLYSISGKENRRWHWSLPGVEFNDKDVKWSAEQRKSLHFIDNEKKWREAQSYCRENHTDLASGAEQLKEAVSTFKSSDETRSWIGLFRDTWRWSDGSNDSYRHWRDVENFILIKENKKWDEALTYCQRHHHDLVSITNSEEEELVKEKVKNATTPYVWLGLHFSCVFQLWLWVSDRVVCYENWANEDHAGRCGMSVAMETGGEHKWFKKNDSEMFNFICSLR
uniref:macrophage mannose receptor 1-like n=1 Tax=Maylandia zebra TaxID=106582 RepID=UPI000D324708|nr:macrophage mannose receptor 1-like [Maylandia zebra]